MKTKVQEVPNPLFEEESTEAPAAPVRFADGNHFLRIDNVWTFNEHCSISTETRLAPGVYVLGHNPIQGWNFTEQPVMSLPSRIYGLTLQDADRILTTYHDRAMGTNVLLVGEKGSGKTLLMKAICRKAIEQGMPVILINQVFNGNALAKALVKIQQDCVIAIDEFEKIYDADHQAELLTILDGMQSSKKLVIATCNELHRVSTYMTNRPGRFYYHLEYRGLDKDFIEEYCRENLLNQEHLQGVCSLTDFYSAFNFDMLQALVQEMNRYGENALQAARYLNVKPDFHSGGGVFDLKLFKNGQEIVKTDTIEIYPDTLHQNPLRQGNIAVQVSTYVESKKDGEEGKWNRENIQFTLDHLIGLPKGKDSTYVFVNGDYRLEATQRKVQSFGMADLERWVV